MSTGREFSYKFSYKFTKANETDDLLSNIR